MKRLAIMLWGGGGQETQREKWGSGEGSRGKQHATQTAELALNPGFAAPTCTSTWLSSRASKSSSAILTVETATPAAPECGENTKTTLDQVSLRRTRACEGQGCTTKCLVGMQCPTGAAITCRCSRQQEACPPTASLPPPSSHPHTVSIFSSFCARSTISPTSSAYLQQA